MNDSEILAKIKAIPQTRYTLANTKTELLKVNKSINRLCKIKEITKRYFHVDNSLQVVYIPFDFKGFLINYKLNKKEEVLIFFKDYFYVNFDLFLMECWLLDTNKWVIYTDVYIDKKRVRCF